MTHLKEIQFRIHKIETLQFALLQDKADKDKMSFSGGFGFRLDPKAGLIRSSFKYEFFNDETPALILEVAIGFTVDISSFRKQIEGNSQIYVIPKGFALHLAMITVGTSRGILHERTKDSLFNAFPIPTIDITKSITSDISLSLETEKSNTRNRTKKEANRTKTKR